ncbi:MAG TPA: biliverdin-producing heme oxygenase [Lamprocystis sp. (in: g-proteobacteria)]|nr:biliverdin-producing heme oxygenase [Lamprocystis sp. (in: g-proteobacteria)]
MPTSPKPFPPKVAPHLVGALRSATAPIHQAVERLPVMARLTSPAVGPVDYRRYLAAMAGVYGGMEPTLFATLAASLPSERIAALCLRPKYPALEADLAANGLMPPVPVRTPSESRGVSSPLTLSAALGGLYVLEGATLGGRVILRQLRRSLGERLVGDTFLAFHGDQASGVWKAFSHTLEDLVAEGLVVPNHTINAACSVFDQVYRMLASVTMSDADERPRR